MGKSIYAFLTIVITVMAACSSSPVKTAGERKVASQQETLATFESNHEKFSSACSFGEYTTLLVLLVPGVKEVALSNLAVYRSRNDATIATLNVKNISKNAKYNALKTLIQQTELSLALQAPYLQLACGKLLTDLTISLNLLKDYTSRGKFAFATVRLNEVNKQLDQIAGEISEI